MKSFLCVLCFLVQGLMAESLEVRSYRVELGVFYRVHMSLNAKNDFHRPSSLDVREGWEKWLGAKVKKAPFESRFLKNARELRDCRKRVAEMFKDEEFSGMAVYDSGAGRFVIQASLHEHWVLQQLLMNRSQVMMRTEVAVYRVPEVQKEKSKVFGEVKRPEGELLSSVLCVHQAGQEFEVRAPDGLLEFKGEAQMDLLHRDIDLRLSLEAKLPLAQFSMKTGCALSTGIPMNYELGSLDGQSSVVLVLQSDFILIDGTLLDDWILKEEGAAFLKEERRAILGELDQANDWGDEIRRFTVPAAFGMSLILRSHYHFTKEMLQS